MVLDHAADPSGAMHIALAADAGFAMPLAVTLASLARTHAAGEVEVTVLHDRLPPPDIARIERGLAGRIDVTWRQVEMGELEDAHPSTFLSKATLFRLLLPTVLPPSLERVVYLDCDLVVAGSLRRLWEHDLGGRSLAAVRDAGTPFAAGPYGTDWRGLGLAPDSPYFNAGVLLISLPEWRAEDATRKGLDLVRRTRMRWGDQDALNIVFEGRWAELERRWNLQTPDASGIGLAWALWRDDVEEAVADPAVIHYSERDKPWRSGSAHPLADRWYEALEESEWSGWRPRRSLDLRRRAAAKARRAGRRLTVDGFRAAT
jgi:lipopolysaccharide biosynthesis glycosyltransferase